MKISLIRTDKKSQEHLSTKTFEAFIDYVKESPLAEDIRQMRFWASQTDDARLFDVRQKQLPRVQPSVELTRDANGHFAMKVFNGVLLLAIDHLAQDEVARLKRQAQVLPTTLAAITGASGRSVLVLVRATRSDGSLPTTEGEARQFCLVAYPLVVAAYEAVLGRKLGQQVVSLNASMLMTLDGAPFFNPKATAFRIDDLAAPTVGVAQAEAATTAGGDAKVSEQTQQLIQFLTDTYRLRYNTVMGYAEYEPKQGLSAGWMPVDERVLNTMSTNARLAGLNVWDKDVKRIVNSTIVRPFDPVKDYLMDVYGTWDGRDHIARLAATVPTDNPLWPQWLRTWLLAMVCQWLGRNRRYGNALVPLLISTQGYNKSTFCRQLIPAELSWGYTDNLQLQDKKTVLQQMGQMLLINLDEFNQISPQLQQGFLKNLVQLPSVKVKRPYGKHVEEFPRLASFIATTNVTDVLADPTGSRRFLGVELKGPINVATPPNHRQLYAQALHLLYHDERYWFNEAETRQIIAYNRRFQQQSPSVQLFYEHFEVAQGSSGADGEWLTAAAIYACLREKTGSLIKASALNGFGRELSSLPGIQRKHSNTGTLYLVKKK
ncbi:MAG: DUF3874 domain-containing protein [Prevotella sp.]|nr:DUF3874 domain-containing protein [Prevotella sp.]